MYYFLVHFDTYNICFNQDINLSTKIVLMSKRRQNSFPELPTRISLKGVTECHSYWLFHKDGRGSQDLSWLKTEVENPKHNQIKNCVFSTLDDMLLYNLTLVVHSSFQYHHQLSSEVWLSLHCNGKQNSICSKLLTVFNLLTCRYYRGLDKQSEVRSVCRFFSML